MSPSYWFPEALRKLWKLCCIWWRFIRRSIKVLFLCFIIPFSELLDTPRKNRATQTILANPYFRDIYIRTKKNVVYCSESELKLYLNVRIYTVEAGCSQPSFQCANFESVYLVMRLSTTCHQRRRLIFIIAFLGVWFRSFELNKVGKFGNRS